MRAVREYERVCPTCNGRGIVAKDSLCPKCKGERYIPNPVKLS
jgi:DnaJ-class molecular chaperone